MVVALSVLHCTVPMCLLRGGHATAATRMFGGTEMLVS